MYDSFRILEKCCPRINLPIVMNEGGAKNRLWRRIITDVFNVPTVLLQSRIGAPFGDAVLAGVATGVFKDFSIARQRAEYVDPMEPISENHQRYMDYHDLFGQLYQHLKCDFVSLAKLRQQHHPG
jgi:xylulokinase